MEKSPRCILVKRHHVTPSSSPTIAPSLGTFFPSRSYSMCVFRWDTIVEWEPFSFRTASSALPSAVFSTRVFA